MTRYSKVRISDVSANGGIINAGSISGPVHAAYNAEQQTIDPAQPKFGNKSDIRVGLAVDVQSYQPRNDRKRADIQRRLSDLAATIIAKYGDSEDSIQQNGGDGFMMFLPPDLPAAKIVKIVKLLRKTLKKDNSRSSDLMRLRCVVDCFPARPDSLGVSGESPIRLARILDSTELRKSLTDNNDTQLAVALTDTAYAFAQRNLPENELWSPILITDKHGNKHRAMINAQ